MATGNRVAYDSQIERGWISRTVCVVLFLVSALVIPYYLLSYLAEELFENLFLGTVAGIFLSAELIGRGLPAFLIQVRELTGFMTLDLLTNKYVTYGPGLHPCFPWESRRKENNIFLGETGHDLSVKVISRDGPLDMSGSYRRSADLAHLPMYLSGAAAAQGEVEHLIKAYLGSKLSTKGEEEIRTGIELINADLTAQFANNMVVTKFEETFGLHMGDVTFFAPLPSVEVQKALSAKNEAQILFAVMAEIAGYRGRLDQFYADWPNFTDARQTELRKVAMAMSEQAKFEYNETKHIFDIQATPEIADALKNAGPSIAALLATMNQTKKKGN